LLPFVYGTDLLGPMHRYQLDEFAIRGEVLKPVDVIRSATSTAAQLFQREGELGVVAPGARADLLVVEGNPLEDLALMREPDRNLKLLFRIAPAVAVLVEPIHDHPAPRGDQMSIVVHGDLMLEWPSCLTWCRMASPSCPWSTASAISRVA
jgi:hypothetical protein